MQKCCKAAALSILLFFSYGTTYQITDVNLPYQNKAKPISINGYTCELTAVVLDETAMGFIPAAMTESEQIIWVEFKLLSGDREGFKQLGLQLDYGADQKAKPCLLFSRNVTKMLATVTLKATAAFYKPKQESIAWAFMLPASPEKLLLKFPSGISIDLRLYLH